MCVGTAAVLLQWPNGQSWRHHGAVIDDVSRQTYQWRHASLNHHSFPRQFSTFFSLSKAQYTAGNWTELNSTQLNSTELDRSVQFSFPLCIETATTCDEATTGDGRCRFLTVKNLRRASQLVAGSIHSGKLNWTQLNLTERSSSVEFSWVQFSFLLCIGLNLVDFCRMLDRSLKNLKCYINSRLIPGNYQNRWSVVLRSCHKILFLVFLFYIFVYSVWLSMSFLGLLHVKYTVSYCTGPKWTEIQISIKASSLKLLYRTGKCSCAATWWTNVKINTARFVVADNTCYCLYLPQGDAKQLGSLLLQASFSVWLQNGYNRMRFKLSPTCRHLFLYEQAIMFCKLKPQLNSTAAYVFKTLIKVFSAKSSHSPCEFVHR